MIIGNPTLAVAVTRNWRRGIRLPLAQRLQVSRVVIIGLL